MWALISIVTVKRLEVLELSCPIHGRLKKLSSLIPRAGFESIDKYCILPVIKSPTRECINARRLILRTRSLVTLPLSCVSSSLRPRLWKSRWRTQRALPSMATPQLFVIQREHPSQRSNGRWMVWRSATVDDMLFYKVENWSKCKWWNLMKEITLARPRIDLAPR